MAEPTPPEAHPNSGTGAGMIAFFNWAIKQHELLENSAVALRTGVKRVLETDESLFDADMQTFEIEDVIRRYRNKMKGSPDFKEASVEEYIRRFRQSVEMYVKWLNNDPTWRPPARKAAPAKAPAKNGGSGKAAQSTATNAVVPAQPTAITATLAAPVTPVGVEMQVYPYPVRPGVMAQVVLPVDLTAKEAKRLATFVASLAFEEQLAITAGPAAE